MSYFLDDDKWLSEEPIEFHSAVVIDGLDDALLRDCFDAELESDDASNPTTIPHHDLIHIVGSTTSV